MNPNPSAPGDAQLLVSVMTYLKTKNGAHVGLVSSNPVAQEIAVAAAGILGTAARGGLYLDEAHVAATLRHWASGSIEPNEYAFPQLVAAVLLWGDTAKNGA